MEEILIDSYRHSEVWSTKGSIIPMKLSIITINYNNLHGLQKTIASVVAQTCKEFEWIIIDGGSTDGSRNVIEQKAQHLTYWCSEPDKGIYNAMNKGIKRATGEYCLFLNSGDIIHDKNVIEKVKMELDGTDFISGNVLLMNNDNQYLREVKSPDVMCDFFLLEMALCHQGTFIRTDLLKRRPYDEGLKIVADWEQMFWELFINRKEYRHIELVVSDYLVGGISEKQSKLLNEERMMIRNKYLSLCEQDKICFDHYFSKQDEVSFRKMTEIAYTALINQHCSSKEFNDFGGKYKKVIMKYGSLHQRICIWLSLNGCMRMVLFLHCLLTRRDKGCRILGKRKETKQTFFC